ncbi:MAG: hypothetical protein H0T46_34375 [Deltaproteobacteria bacterium]|nr:hypothetical protein [Deltaproteobacteria bacterium]
MTRTVALVLLASCHVTTQTEVTRPATEEIVQHPEGAIAHRPTLVLSESGSLRFVQPLECPTERVVSSSTAIELETRPNLATFVVGVIATAVGGVMTVGGIAGKDSAANPITYAGVGLLLVGLPLAIGPWTGLGKRLRDGGTTKPTRAPGASVPCGARGLAAKSATLTIRGLEVHGAVWQDGTFSVSPYQIIDAYAPTAINAWDISAIVDAEGGARTIEAVIDGGQLAKFAPQFLARADFNGKVEPLRLVPGMVPGTLRVSLTTTSAGPALRVVLPVKNDGPGETWGLRGQIASPTKSVDGRMLYIGHIGNGQTVTRELLIPLTVAAADVIRGATLDLSIELRDAHGTAPANPVRFRGNVLNDAPR